MPCDNTGVIQVGQSQEDGEEGRVSSLCGKATGPGGSVRPLQRPGDLDPPERWTGTDRQTGGDFKYISVSWNSWGGRVMLRPEQPTLVMALGCGLLILSSTGERTLPHIPRQGTDPYLNLEVKFY